MIEILNYLVVRIWILILAVIPVNESITLGIYQQPTTLLPHENQNEADRLISSILYYNLFEYDQNGNLVSKIFETWEINESNTVFNLKLKDAIWQNGEKITTRDVLYTLSNYPEIIDEINISISSDKDIELSIAKPNAILLENLSIPLQPDLRFTNNTQIIGSTDYNLALVRWKSDEISELVFVSRNRNQKLRKIKIKVYKDIGATRTAYERGEITAFSSISPYLNEGVVESVVTYLGQYSALILNTKKANIADLTIRRKLNSAIDKSRMQEISYFENVNMIESPLDNNILFNLPNQVQTDNQRLTNEELEKIGTLKVVLPDNTVGIQIEGIISTNWKIEQNIDLEILFQSEKELLESAKNGDFDVILMGFEISKDPDQFAYWHSSQTDGGFNFSFLEDAKLDKALEEGRKTREISERRQHYTIFNEVMAEKQPAIFLYNPTEYFYISTRKAQYIDLPKSIYYPWEILDNIHIES